MLPNPITYIKDRRREVLLTAVVFLLALFSFAMGYLVNEYTDKNPLEVETSSVAE